MPGSTLCTMGIREHPAVLEYIPQEDGKLQRRPELQVPLPVQRTGHGVDKGAEWYV